MSILEPEAGIWYIGSWAVVVARLISTRMRLASWRELLIDDYLAIVAMCNFTTVLVVMHVILYTGNHLLEQGDDIPVLSQEDMLKLAKIPKLAMVLEQMQMVQVWLVKGCLLVMYSRLTELLRLRLVVKLVAVYVGLSFILMEILWFAVWCRPFSQYWVVPSFNNQCSTMINHMITYTVFNISSDVMILAIPLPLVFKVRLPLRNKMILGGMLCLGIFTICAAAMSKHAAIKDPTSSSWMIWYLRESSVATICANLPLTRPVLIWVFDLEKWMRMTSLGRYLESLRTFRLKSTSEHASTDSSDIFGDESKPSSQETLAIGEEYLHASTSPLGIRCQTVINIAHHVVENYELGTRLETRAFGELGTGRTAEGNMPRPRSLTTACYHEPGLV